jgi:hypothetical protein
VRLDKIGEGGEQPSDDELNKWIRGFPIEPLRPWHRGAGTVSRFSLGQSGLNLREGLQGRCLLRAFSRGRGLRISRPIYNSRPNSFSLCYVLTIKRHIMC